MKNEIDSYLKTRAKNTERRFRYVLKVYLDFLAKKFGRMSYDNLKKADTIDVLHFYDFLKARKGTPARDNPQDILAATQSVNNAMETLFAIHEMLVTEGKLSRNVFKTRIVKLEHRSARPKRKTEVVPQSIVKKLLRTTKGNTKQNQLRVLIALMLGGALRINEALNLKISDICLDSQGYPYIKLKGTKSGIDEDHAIAQWCYRFLVQQVTRRRNQGAQGHENLFVSYYKDGRIKQARYPTETAFKHIKAALKKHGLPNCSPHSFRKTAINKLVEMGLHVEKIRQFARHDSILTTQGYFAKFSPKDSAANKFDWM
jgi:integrase